MVSSRDVRIDVGLATGPVENLAGGKERQPRVGQKDDTHIYS